VNKTAVNAAQLANYILLRAYSRTTAAPSCASTNKNFISLFNHRPVTRNWAKGGIF